ncbi:MAG: hypothetical protein KF817_14495 [Phycisphaeraceae bacterium]|nr:hypothetical protein [Phycisphaeraceae bacterium]
MTGPCTIAPRTTAPGRDRLRALVRAGVIVGAIALGAGAHARVVEDPVVSRTAVAAEAASAYAQGMDLLADDPAAAREAFRRARAGYDVLRRDGVDSGALAFNLGTCHLRLGDVAIAIAEFRRALALGGVHADARASLREARTLVRTPLEAGVAGSAWMALLDWCELRPVRPWLLAALVAWGAGWLCLAWAPAHRPWVRRLGAAAVVIGALAAVPPAVARWVAPAFPAAVLTGAETMPRTGNGSGYPALFGEPLAPGIEVRVVEVRPGWSRVRFSSGDTGWVPQDALRPIGAAS